MSRMIFVNLPVPDLERSKAFYEAIGFRNEPKFTNDAAAMMVLSRHHLRDAAHSSLLCNVHPQADCRREQQQSGAAVHFLRQPGGGRPDHRRRGRRGRQGRRLADEAGPRAGRCTAASFEDPDGHQWEPMWMDPEFAEQGAHPVEERHRRVTI